MEHQVDGAELMGKVEGDGMGARLPYHIEWSKVLFQQFLRQSPGPEKLCLNICLVPDLQLGTLCPVLVCIPPIPFLSLCDVLLQLHLDVIQVHYECLCLCQQCHCLWICCEFWVVPFVCKQWGYSHHRIHGIVVGEFCHQEKHCPVVLLVVHINP